MQYLLFLNKYRLCTANINPQSMTATNAVTVNKNRKRNESNKRNSLMKIVNALSKNTKSSRYQYSCYIHSVTKKLFLIVPSCSIDHCLDKHTAIQDNQCQHILIQQINQHYKINIFIFRKFFFMSVSMTNHWSANVFLSPKWTLNFRL